MQVLKSAFAQILKLVDAQRRICTALDGFEVKLLDG